MKRLSGTCFNCGASFSTTVGEETFCEFCEMPLPSPSGGLNDQRTALLEVMVGHMADKNWKALEKVLRRIVILTTERKLKARYLYTLGSILATRLLKKEEALECWQEAIDADPSCLRAFADLAEIYKKNGNWQELEQQYKIMIELTIKDSNDSKVLEKLWRGLGYIYQDHLSDPGAAQTCFERAGKHER